MASAASTCTLLSPALPSELLGYILRQSNYPTTLIICSARSEFIASLLEEVRHEASTSGQSRSGYAGGVVSQPNRNHAGDTARDDDDTLPEPNSDFNTRYQHLLTSPLHQLATSRHIRTLYMPTVTHLRAYLSVSGVPSSTKSTGAGPSAEDSLFSSSSKVPAPPPPPHPSNCEEYPAEPGAARRRGRRPMVFIYGFLDLHRGTSEWSAQGLSHSCSTLVEFAHQMSLREVHVVEPACDGNILSWRTHDHDDDYNDDDGDVDHHHNDDNDEGSNNTHDSNGHNPDTSNKTNTNSRNSKGRRTTTTTLEEILSSNVPLLTSGSALRKLGIDADEPGWAGRTVQVGRVLKRWFRFQRGEWGR